MDGLSALSAASSIVTFVDFGLRLFATAKELSISATGETERQSFLRGSCERLDDLSKDLTAHLSNGTCNFSKHERRILDIAEECKKVARQLGKILESLRPETGKSLSAFTKALRSMLKRKEILELQSRLQHAKIDINTHMLAALASHQSQIWDLIRSQSSNRATEQGIVHDTLEELRKHLLTAINDSTAETSTNVNERVVQIVQDLREQVGSLSQQQRFLQDLYFDDMHARQWSVQDKSTGTYDWIWDSEHAGEAVGFKKWLENERGHYWIVGKPGSGKSTLMKAIIDDPNTHQALRRWASDRRLITSSFFFWNAGSPIQKSQEGLLRCLLYDIFRQRPDLIPLQSVSGAIPNATIGLEASIHQRRNLSLPSLVNMIRDLDRSLRETTSVCFFIDGLDEYDGDNQELTDALLSLLSSPAIKICMSSRPRPAFQATFGGVDAWTLTLEQHTKNDIEQFIQQRLINHVAFRRLQQDDTAYLDVIDQISAKSRGVFFWIFLVVSNIRHSLANLDTVSELQQRIDRVPQHLETYFMQMLDAIDPVYYTVSSKILLVMLESKVTVSLCVVYYILMIENGYDVLRPNFRQHQIPLRPMYVQVICNVRGKLAADNDLYYIWRPEHGPLETRQTELALTTRGFKVIDSTEIRLRARCPDLLEIVRPKEWWKVSITPSQTEVSKRTPT